MSKIRLQAAKELIQSGEHQAAIAILETMPTNATAQKWLERLQSDHITHRSIWSRTKIMTALAAIPILVLAGIGAYSLLPSSAQMSKERIVESYCRWNAPRDVNDIGSYCDEQVPIMLAENAQLIDNCYMRSDEGRLEEGFFNCMSMADFRSMLDEMRSNEPPAQMPTSVWNTPQP